MKRWNMKRMKSFTVMLLSLFLITGCGGGGGDDDPENEKIGIRIINLKADATIYDVEIKEEETIIESFEGFKFSDNSGYYYFEEDDADITFTPHNVNEEAIEKEIECEEGEKCSVFFFGDNEDPIIYANDQKGPVAKMASIRFVHGIKGLDKAVTIKYGAEDTLFDGVEYKEFTDYENLDPGKYVFEIFDSNGASLYKLKAVSLLENEIYTVVAMGDALATPGTEYLPKAIIYKDTGDGKSEPYAKLKLVHASPDAGAVTVAINGEALPGGDIIFKSATGYIEVFEGENTIVITSHILADPITVTENIVNAYSTVFVMGTVANNDLQVAVYNDDLATHQEGFAHIRLVHTVVGAPNIDLVEVAEPVNPLLENIAYNPTPVDSKFYKVAAKDYQLEVRQAGEITPIVDVQAITLNNQSIITFFVAGSLETQGSITLETIDHMK